MNPADEINMLRDEANAMKSELNAINKRIEELETSSQTS
jgi:prefoldin subunit 5